MCLARCSWNLGRDPKNPLTQQSSHKSVRKLCVVLRTFGAPGTSMRPSAARSKTFRKSPMCDRRHRNISPLRLRRSSSPHVEHVREVRRGSTTIGKTRFPDASQFDPLLHPPICPRGGGYGKIVIQFQLIRERKFLDGL